MDKKDDKSMNELKAECQANRIAAKIGNYCLKKTFRRNSNGTITFFYSVKGDFENTTINQINIISELLQSSFNDDYVTIFEPCQPEIFRMFESKVSLEHSVIYLYVDLKFTTAWEPTEDFWEI